MWKNRFETGGSDFNFSNWIKKKKTATVNPKNDNNKCFQYATTIKLNFEEIKKDPQRLSNIKAFIIDISKKMCYIHFKNLFRLWKQLVLLMVPNVEKESSYFFSVKTLSVLLHWITFNVNTRMIVIA